MLLFFYFSFPSSHVLFKHFFTFFSIFSLYIFSNFFSPHLPLPFLTIFSHSPVFLPLSSSFPLPFGPSCALGTPTFSSSLPLWLLSICSLIHLFFFSSPHPFSFLPTPSQPCYSYSPPSPFFTTLFLIVFFFSCFSPQFLFIVPVSPLLPVELTLFPFSSPLLPITCLSLLLHSTVNPSCLFVQFLFFQLPLCSVSSPFLPLSSPPVKGHLTFLLAPLPLMTFSHAFFHILFLTSSRCPPPPFFTFISSPFFTLLPIPPPIFFISMNWIVLHLLSFSHKLFLPSYIPLPSLLPPSSHHLFYILCSRYQLPFSLLICPPTSLSISMSLTFSPAPNFCLSLLSPPFFLIVMQRLSLYSAVFSTLVN